jgi:hypothetical protein
MGGGCRPTSKAGRHYIESSLRGAKRRGNPVPRCITLDCRASLAMTELVQSNVIVI